MKTLILLFLFCLLLSDAQQPEKKKQCVQVNVLFRHGDRSPIKTFPTDQYQERFWPRGWGQLSKRGQLQHLELGKMIRHRYGDLIGKFYYPDVVQIRSTDFDRTLMSAMSNLAGLYPPNDNETWATGLPWQPLPVHTVAQHHDNLLLPFINCPRYRAMNIDLWTVHQPPEVVKEKTKYGVFWKWIRQMTGLGYQVPIHDMRFIADTLHIEKIYSLDLPKWVNMNVYKHMMEFQKLNFQIAVYNQTLVKLSGGNLLHQIIKNMQKKLKEKTDNKMIPSMWIYSAHDTTVASFLATLSLFNNLAPPYASCVFVELWKGHGIPEPYIRVLYRNDTDLTPKAPLLLKIPNCSTECPMSRFLELTKASIPKDYKQECRLPTDSKILRKYTTPWVIQ